MKLKGFRVDVILVLLLLVGLFCSPTYAAETLPPGSKLPEITLKGPNAPQVKAYLGVADEKLFSLSQIQAKLTLVEFFDVFCPVCQKNAPVLNRVYQLFKEDKNLGKDFKMIGIGIGTQPEDLPAYVKAFKVEFPLLADPKKEVQKKVNLQNVPHTILLDRKGKILMSHAGFIGNFDAFVIEIRKHYKAQ
jgi:peroxiredoxin